MTARWSAAGVEVRPWSEHRPGEHVTVAVPSRCASLPPELARSLAWWLLWWHGDRTTPAPADRVRVAVDAARMALRERSAAVETTPDFRAGLAWCDHHLDAIAEAAS